MLRVIYLIFTEGYANPERGGSSEALCNEAIRLARLLRDLLSNGESFSRAGQFAVSNGRSIPTPYNAARIAPHP